ncbi:MAG TPA: flippase activity-associated protein Agl23, partial [Vicinamibacteria bacterium]
MTFLRSRGPFLALVLLAAALRFPELARRPMHADEGVHADKLGTLLEGGGYVYDPTEYHGPTLYYMTLVPAWLQGARLYVDIDEVTLRSVPAALGVALVAAHLGARAFLGSSAALVAALLAAISPAMVFYSRYYIHETPLVLFTFGALLGTGFYLRRRSVLAALLTGACAGLMHATKETAPRALGSLVGALVLTRAADRWRGDSPPPARSLVSLRDLLLAVLAAATVSVTLFSSFFSHPAGIFDSVRTWWLYVDRASAATWHFHPWHYYLGLLVHFPARGTPFWTEGLVLVLAGAGALAGWRSPVPGPDARVLRFLGFYTLLLLAAYAVIPYKTPWCLLGFLHGMVLLAGAGAVLLVRSLRGRAARALAVALVSLASVHLAYQAWAGSFRFPADPRNPYVYAHTGDDVFVMVERLKALARVHPDGAALAVQVVSRENLWPLPFYLRGFTHVGWWNGVSDEAPAAPVILATPDM